LGDLTISYQDDYGTYEPVFSTNFVNSRTPTYNQWVTIGGESVFHAMFEDEYGAIILIVDDVVDLGDGGGAPEKLSGSIWFKNHGFTGAPTLPGRPGGDTAMACWEISRGPYDCRVRFEGPPTRTSITPIALNTSDSSTSPTQYIKLGTFSNLSRSQSFGE
jgi:hypothetical protein